jgi:hypothetical protein
MRKSIPFSLLVAVVAVGVGFALQPDPGIRFDAFKPRFRDAFQHGGYRILGISSCRPEEAPLPLTVAWHPRRWRGDSSTHFNIGFPNSAARYTVTIDGAPSLQCYVRYLDGRASIIIIRASTTQQTDGADLRSTLAHEFPRLPIWVRSL